MGQHGYRYAGCRIHRVIPAFIIQGEYRRSNGTLGHSIYGADFKGWAGLLYSLVHSFVDFKTIDENFVERHSKPGVLSMVNTSRDRNRSQFFIHMAINGFLDGSNVVFGTLGMNVVILTN